MRKLIYLVCVGALLFFLTETNPTRADYVDWLTEKTLDESSNIFEKGVISLAGEAFFEAATEKDDYYIFSIYTTDFSDLGKGKMKSIGVFNQIIPIDKIE